MDVLQIALVVLVLVGVWAVVEIAITMRSARRDIEKVTTAATEVIEQAQPVVAKLDGIVDEMEPAAKRLAPLAVKVEGTVDAANNSLERVSGILEDVSSVSGTASSVTGAVNRVAESAASGVASVVSRLRGAGTAESAACLEGPAEASPQDDGEVVVPREPQAPTRYVDYGELGAPGQDDTKTSDAE